MAAKQSCGFINPYHMLTSTSVKFWLTVVNSIFNKNQFKDVISFFDKSFYSDVKIQASVNKQNARSQK